MGTNCPILMADQYAEIGVKRKRLRSGGKSRECGKMEEAASQRPRLDIDAADWSRVHSECLGSRGMSSLPAAGGEKWQVKLSLRTGCSKDPVVQGQAWVSWVSMEKPRDSGFQTKPLGCLVASSYLEEMLTSGTLDMPSFSSARTGRTIAASSCDLERGWVLFCDPDFAVREEP